jgi:excisionase family DNA binding protein
LAVHLLSDWWAGYPEVIDLLTAGTHSQPTTTLARGGRPLAFTADEAAELLHVSPSVIRNLVHTGALPRITGLGRAIRIPSRALYEFAGEPLPALPEGLEPEPTEVLEPAPSAEERKSRPARSASPVDHLSIGPTVERRQRPAAPEGPIRVGDRRLWLLADSSHDSVSTWHIGVDQALCGRVTRGQWKRSGTRSPYATMCPACLTAVARSAGVEMSSIPITTVCMVREARRGDSVALIKSGWHLGDGRVTNCGKRDGTWHLTERAPRKDMCFVCGERRCWERERIKGSAEARSAKGPRWTVLLDQSVAVAEVEELARRAPGFFAVRRAIRGVTPDDFKHWNRGLHELFATAQVIPGTSGRSRTMAPDITITADQDLLRVGPGTWRLKTLSEFIVWVTPQIERVEKAKVLRARWDREASGQAEGDPQAVARGRGPS